MDDLDELNKKMKETFKGRILKRNNFKNKVKRFLVTATAVISLLGFAKENAHAQSTPENIRQIEQKVIMWGSQLRNMSEDKREDYRDLLVRYSNMYTQEMIDEVDEYKKAGRYREALTAVQRIRNIAEIVGDEELLNDANNYEETIRLKQETRTLNKNNLVNSIIQENRNVKPSQTKKIAISGEEYIISKAKSRNLSQAQRMAENQILNKTGKSGQNLGVDFQRENNYFIVTVVRKIK